MNLHHQLPKPDLKRLSYLDFGIKSQIPRGRGQPEILNKVQRLCRKFIFFYIGWVDVVHVRNEPQLRRCRLGEEDQYISLSSATYCNDLGLKHTSSCKLVGLDF